MPEPEDLHAFSQSGIRRAFALCGTIVGTVAAAYLASTESTMAIGVQAAVLGGIALFAPVECSLLSFIVLFQLPSAIPLARAGSAEVMLYDLVYTCLALRATVALMQGRHAAFAWSRSAAAGILFAFLLWGCVCLGAAAYAKPQAAGSYAAAWMRVLQLGLLTFMVPLLVRKETQFTRILQFLVALAYFQILAATARWLPYTFFGFDWYDAFMPVSFKSGLGLSGDFFLAGYGSRLTGTFGDPAKLGHFLLVVLCFLVAVGALQAREAIRERFSYSGFAMLIVAVTLALSQTRTSVIGAAAAALVWMAWNLRFSRQRATSRESALAIGLCACAAIAAGALMADAGILQSILRMRMDDSIAGRLEMIGLDWNLALANPVFGVGWSGGRFYGVALPWGEPVYTRVAAELGFAGLLLFLSWQAAMLASTWRNSLCATNEHTRLAACWQLLVIAAYLGLGFGDITLYGGSHATLMLFFGAGLYFAALNFASVPAVQAVRAAAKARAGYPDPLLGVSAR